MMEPLRIFGDFEFSMRSRNVGAVRWQVKRWSIRINIIAEGPDGEVEVKSEAPK
jgi:hypothetical protein